MSTLRVTNVQDTAGANSSTSAEIFSGRAKAWVNFNGTGTVAIRANFNVSSITDNGTGDYTMNFTTALADANYAFTSAVGGGANGNSSFVCGVRASTQFGTASNKTTGGVRFLTGDYTAAARDLGEIYVSIFR